MKKIRKAVIVDAATQQDANSKEKMRVFKLIEFRCDADTYEEKDIIKKWDFSTFVANERDLITLMRNGMAITNAVLAKKEGKIIVKGNHGSLEKFNSNSPIVIISELRYIGEDITIGYRVALGNGTVKTVRRKDLLLYCARQISVGNEFPLQNASFVKNNGSPFIRRNNTDGNDKDNGGIMVEYLVRAKNKHTVKPSEPEKKEEVQGKSKVEEVKNMYTPEQLQVIKETRKRHSQKWKLITNPKLSAEQMKVLSRGLDKNTNIALINDPSYNIASMKNYIEDMSYGLDIRHYLNPKYKPSQIQELSLAYEEGLDLEQMADPKNDANAMAEIRVRLENKMWSVSFEGTFDEK